MESERIFANYVSDNGLISKMYKELIYLIARKRLKNRQKILIDIFFKEGMQRYMKKCSILLFIRRMKITL